MRAATLLTFILHVPLVLAASLASAQSGEIRTGAAAFDIWKGDAPGVQRDIKPPDLPAPVATDA